MAGFSYAEAAKGRTPAPVIPAPSKQDQATEQSTSEANANSAPSTENTPTNSSAQAEVARNDSEETLKIEDSTESTSKATTVKSQSVSNASGTASPSLVESTATLNKEDEGNGNTNDSESTTWEKVSQGSQSADKSAAKSSGESDDSKASGSWEHVPAPEPVLKEAPLPTVNPWTKRAQEAKAKTSPPSSAISSIPNTAGDANQSRKKSRPSVSESNGTKPGDKATQAAEGAQRRYKPSSETRLATRLPPPTSDAVSWPTPDSAKTDEKDKDKSKSTSQERTDTTEQDKDRAASSKKGKTQWESIPFVPTAVFNTPLPTGRRGGRPSGRGGRDMPAGRGGPNVAGDRASEGSGRTPSTEAPVDRSRGDAAHSRQAQGAPRQKRLSNAGQTRPRDFRKTAEGVKPEESRVNGADTSSVHDAVKDGHAAAPADGSDGANAASQHIPFAEQGLPNGEPNSAGSFQDARSTRSYRGDFHGQGKEYGRESNGMPREGRSERGGRGGPRGRGGFNNSGYPHGSHASGNNSYTPSTFGTPKSHGHYDRQGQYQNYGSGREGKHFRSGSRSQVNGPPSGRFNNFQGMPPYPGGPVPPEMAAPYGYPPMPHQQPFYHPAMDQVPLMGIIAEQMRYYFSIDNLLRDLYLRSRMDDQGFIPLHFMMPWRRMRMMTSDINLVRFAIQHVPEIELRLDVDGVDFIRPAKDFEKWVLSREERLEEARTEGPNLQPNVPFAHQFPQQPMFQGQVPPMFAPQGFPPKHSSHKGMNGTSSHQEHTNAQANGHANGSPTHTPLSATVPEFQPNPSFQGQDPFADDQLQNLNLITKTANTGVPLSNGYKSHQASLVEPAPPETNSGPILALSDDE